ncbi:MAG: glycosyltransferase [Beijerinckiaceae bacterium]
MSAHKAGIRTIVIGPTKTSLDENVHGVEIYALRQRRGRMARRTFAPFEAFAKIRSLRPKIVHFHDPEFLLIGLILKALGYKVIWDVHEYYSEVKTAHMKPGPLRSLKRILISALVEKGPCAIFDRSVFPTKSLRTVIRDETDAVACVNLLPVEEFPDAVSQPAKEYDLIFMGTMSPFRAGPFMEMVDILCRRRSGFRAALLGVPGITQEWMQANAHSALALEAIEFLPRVPHSEVAGCLRRARIGFNYHPMERRFQVALPMKVYEYMACGIAVVCTRFPELAEQFTQGEIVFVEGDNQASYAEAILTLLENPEELDRVGRAGEEAVRIRLNWERSEAPKLIAMYRELLAPYAGQGTRGGRATPPR